MVPLQGSGGIRDVLGDLAAGDLIRQLVIISITACHVVVDGDNLSLVGLGVLAELSSLSGYRVALGELNLGSGDQIRGRSCPLTVTFMDLDSTC